MEYTYRVMALNEKIIWSALEYDEREHTQDWFWALGIIVVTSSIASIIFGNYFFAVLLILSGVLLGFFAMKKPDMVTYELNDKGLAVRDRLYLYETLKSFWVQSVKLREYDEQEGIIKPILFIHTERAFMPVISMPTEDELAEKIRAQMLSKNVIEEEMKEHPSEKIMEALGF